MTCAQPSGSPARSTAKRVSEVESDAGVVGHGGEPRPGLALEQQGHRQLGDSLRDERLRRRHEHDRLLDQPPAAHEQLLLAAALDVVAGIRLVDREVEQLDGRHREVDVDRDPAAQVTQVLAERQPGLLANDLEDDALSVRELDQAARPRAGLLDDRPDDGLDLVGRDPYRAFPALVPLGERSVPGQEPLQPLVRGREDRLVGVRRSHAVAALDLVGVRERLACQHAGVGAQADHLVAQPAVLELVEQLLCGGNERPRLGGRRSLDLRRPLGRPEVRIDQPVDVAAELQPQADVPARETRRRSVPVVLRAHTREPTASPAGVFAPFDTTCVRVAPTPMRGGDNGSGNGGAGS